MPSRSQRHLREIQGIDSSGRAPEDGGGVTPPPSPVYAITVVPGVVSVLAGAADTVVVKVTSDGNPLSGATVAAVSDDNGVATASVPGTTDVNGNVTVTITGGSAGTAKITMSSQGKSVGVDATVT